MSTNESARAVARISSIPNSDSETITRWETGPYARGPFGTMFGGLIAGIMVESIDEISRMKYPNLSSAHIDFLRPVQPGLIEVSAKRARRARTMVWFSVTLRQNGKDCATASIIYSAPKKLSGVPRSAWAIGRSEPDALAAAHRSNPLEGPWFGDLLNYKIDETTEQRWFSNISKEALDLSPAGFGVAIADYASGISRPDSWERPAIKAFPNPMMSTVLYRPPEAGWVGLRARSAWHDGGLGVAVTDLLDVNGVFGCSQQINILVPFD